MRLPITIMKCLHGIIDTKSGAVVHADECETATRDVTDVLFAVLVIAIVVGRVIQTEI